MRHWGYVTIPNRSRRLDDEVKTGHVLVKNRRVHKSICENPVLRIVLNFVQQVPIAGKIMAKKHQAGPEHQKSYLRFCELHFGENFIKIFHIVRFLFHDFREPDNFEHFENPPDPGEPYNPE